MIRAGLRLLEQREAALAALRDAIDSGERSGPPEAFGFDTYIETRQRGAGA